jgi:hypothetical protein
MRLRCVQRYRSATLQVEAGRVLEDLTPETVAFLLADAPGSWEDADQPELPADEGEQHETGDELEQEEGEQHETGDEPEQEEGEQMQKPEVKAPDAPAVDKQVKGPPTKKGGTR